jgi:hypothetical protein
MRRVALAALMVATIAAAPPAAEGSPFVVGRFVAVCDLSHESMHDPIVFPGQPGAAHHHQFFGNTRTNAKTTPRKLRRKGETTCRPADDRSGYWIPALHVGGRMVEPTQLRAYFSSRGKDPGSVQAPPKGLEVIAGDSMATTPQPLSIVNWRCYSGVLSDVGDGFAEPPHCPRGSQIVLSIAFPDCWNGTDLDSPDHKSHLTYAQPGSLLQPDATCPASHPVPIAGLSMRVFYPTRGARSDVELSSGGVFSMHADFMNGWRQRTLQAMVDNCIRRAQVCRGA